MANDQFEKLISQFPPKEDLFTRKATTPGHRFDCLIMRTHSTACEENATVAASATLASAKIKQFNATSAHGH